MHNLTPCEIDAEWSSLPSAPSALCTFRKCYSMGLMNRDLNRYPDVLPFDKTRVKLKNSQKYINASYIEICPKYKFIAAQAPLPQSFSDFWLMLWEKHVSVVVMLARFIEKRRVKAHCYWPNTVGSTEDFDGIHVTLEEVEELPHCITVRHFNISIGNESRKIVHIHYTEWPDFGVPDSTEGLRKIKELTEKYSSKNRNSNLTSSSDENIYPILVHCSAGIGRAGTFLAYVNYCELIRLGKDSESVSVRDIVASLRKQRMCMVQTKEQYNFIYKVLQDELADDSGSSDMDSSGSSTTDSEMEEISNASLCTGGSKNFSPKVHRQNILHIRTGSGKFSFCSKPRSFLRTAQTNLATTSYPPLSAHHATI